LGQTSMWYDGGMGIIVDSHGYTETHLFHITAVDAAGNETESERVRVYISHKKEKDEEAALPSLAMAWPVWETPRDEPARADGPLDTRDQERR